MNINNGRLEKEINTLKKVEEKIKTFPLIFNNYYLYLRAAKKTYSTIETYMNGIIRFSKFICGETISDDFYNNVKVENVEAYLISLETTIKKGQVERMGSDALCTNWSYINSFWEFLVKRGYVSENIISKTTRPKNTSGHSVTFLTKQEIKKLFAAIDSCPNEVVRLRDKTFISIGLKVGLRCSAVMNLNINDIDFDNHLITTVEKGNKTRQIAIGNQLEELIKAWIDVRNKNYGDLNTDALFISQKKSRLSVDSANNSLKKYVQTAGIKKHITFHKTRATLASNALNAGVPVLAVSEQLGHSDIKTTMRYLGVFDEDKKKLTDYMDKFV